MEPYKLGKQELKNLNLALIDCANIKEDLERAKMAGVPNVDHIEDAVSLCEERINKLLAIYNPKGKK